MAVIQLIKRLNGMALSILLISKAIAAPSPIILQCTTIPPDCSQALSFALEWFYGPLQRQGAIQSRHAVPEVPVDHLKRDILWGASIGGLGFAMAVLGLKPSVAIAQARKDRKAPPQEDLVKTLLKKLDSADVRQRIEAIQTLSIQETLTRDLLYAVVLKLVDQGLVDAAEVRTASIEGIIALGLRYQNRRGDALPVVVFLNQWLERIQKSSKPHQAISVLKIIERLDLERAPPLVAQLYGRHERNAAGKIYTTGLYTAYDKEYLRLKEQEYLVRDAQARLVSEAREFFKRSSDASLLLAPEIDQDFLLAAYFLAGAAIMHEQLALWSDREYKDLLKTIFKQTEMDSAYKNAEDGSFRVSEENLRLFETPEKWQLRIAREIAHAWLHKRNPLLKRESLKDIEGFSATMIAFTLLEAQGVPRLKLQALLEDAAICPGMQEFSRFDISWKMRLADLRLAVSHVTSRTSYREFVEKVLAQKLPVALALAPGASGDAQNPSQEWQTRLKEAGIHAFQTVAALDPPRTGLRAIYSLMLSVEDLISLAPPLIPGIGYVLAVHSNKDDKASLEIRGPRIGPDRQHPILLRLELLKSHPGRVILGSGVWNSESIVQITNATVRGREWLETQLWPFLLQADISIVEIIEILTPRAQEAFAHLGFKKNEQGTFSLDLRAGGFSRQAA